MFIRSGARKGMTLLEVMVAAGLGLLLLTVLIQVLVPAYRASAKGLGEVDLHQRALLLSGKLERDLRLTARAGVGTHPDTLTIHPRVPLTSAVVWSNRLVVYSKTTAGMRRKEATIPDSIARALTPPLTEIAEWPTVTTLQIPDVTEFEAVINDPALVKISYRLVSGSSSLTWTTSTLLRNSSL